jgi:endonuclease/exonuclease/phosphatase (EEP) superfamily protein YafD
MSSAFRKDTLNVVLVVLLVIAFGCTTLDVFSWLVPQLGLLVHFQLQYVYLLFIIALICATRKKWLLCTASICIMIIPMSRIVPWYLGYAPSNGQESLRVLSSNVKATNENWEAIEEMITSVDAEVVVLLEATDSLQRELSNIDSVYPYTFAKSLDTGTGFLLFSKFPLLGTAAHQNGMSTNETITTTVQTQKGDLGLVAVHPVRPGFRHGNRLNEQELAELSTILESLQGAKDIVVVGDFNTTMWSDGYKKFVAENELVNLRQASGVVPTFGYFLKPVLSIPIDHCFVRGNVQGTSFETIPLRGSDHDAIIAGLTFEEKEERWLRENGYRFIKERTFVLHEGESIEGPVVIWGATSVILDGIVHGNIAVLSSNLVVHGTIDGDLELISVSETLIAEQGVVTGDIRGKFIEMPALHLRIEGKVGGNAEGSIRDIEWAN